MTTVPADPDRTSTTTTLPEPDNDQQEGSAVPLGLQGAAPLTEACGDTPSILCEFLIDRLGGNVALTILIDRILIVPVFLATAFVIHRIVQVGIHRFARGLEQEIHERVERARLLGTRTSETRRLQRLHAIAGAMRSGVGIIIWLTALLLILNRFFDLRPILAGAGLAGIIVGFGAQNMIRDFLAGVSMLIEDQFGVGDWIEVDKTVGEVEHVGLRVTRIRDIDGTTWHIPNGHMQKVGNLTQRWARSTLDVPFALDADVTHVRQVVERVASALAEDPDWSLDIIGPPEVWGVQEWGPDGMSLRLVIPTRPLRNWDVNRQLRERLKHAFDREGIRMPAPMRELGAQRIGEALAVRSVEPPRPPRAQPARHETEETPAVPPDTTQRIPITRPPEPG